MAPSRHTAAAILGLLIILLSAAATLEARGASVGITVTEDSITANYRLELRENLTALPVVNVLLDPSNSSSVIRSIETAIQKQVPDAQIDPSQFSLAAKTTLLNPATNMWSLRENITLVVTGARSSNGALVSYRLDFLSMNMSDQVRLANVELNRVGREYILEPLLSQPSDQTHYFLNGATFLNDFIPGEATKRFNLMDFTWLPAIADWNHDSDPLSKSSTWTYDPATSPKGAPYNLTLGIRPIENTYLKVLVATYSPSLQLTAPARTLAEGATVSFNLPSMADIVMPLIIAGSFFVAMGSFAAERKLIRARPQRKKR